VIDYFPISGGDSMSQRKRWILSVIVLVVIIVVPVLAFRPALIALGQHELYRIAMEKNLRQ